MEHRTGPRARPVLDGLEALEPSAVARLTDAARAGLVFGEPVTADGTTLVPAARVAGGAGTGSGNGAAGGGSGGGLALTARPVGAFVIRGGEVTWRPAFDVDRLVVAGTAIVLAAVLALGGGRRHRR
jgi:uncharacterized spore protein YtfJ